MLIFTYLDDTLVIAVIFAVVWFSFKRTLYVYPYLSAFCPSTIMSSNPKPLSSISVSSLAFNIVNVYVLFLPKALTVILTFKLFLSLMLNLLFTTFTLASLLSICTLAILYNDVAFISTILVSAGTTIAYSD